MSHLDLVCQLRFLVDLRIVLVHWIFIVSFLQYLDDVIVLFGALRSTHHVLSALNVQQMLTGHDS